MDCLHLNLETIKILADMKVSIKEFLISYYGFEDKNIIYCAFAVAGFTIVFALAFGAAIKVFNFQRR